MDLSVRNTRLVQNRSDDLDIHDLINEGRDVLNGEGRYYRIASTTSATLLTAWSMALKRDTALFVTARVVAYCAATNEGASYWRRATIKRQGAGLAVLIGAAQVVAADHEDDATWDVGVAVNAPTNGIVSVSVQGAAGKSIGWRIAVNALEAPWEG